MKKGIAVRFEQRVDLGNRRGVVFQSPQRASQRLEIRRLVGDHHIGNVLPEVVDHYRVQGAAPDDHDMLARHFLDEFQDLPGHHEAEPGRHTLLGYAFVRGVRAVAFAEHAATSRYLVRLFRSGQADGVFKPDADAIDLLQKELAGAGGAFVPRMDGRNPAVAPQVVEHERLAAGADDRLNVLTVTVGMQKGLFDGLRFGYGGQIDQMPELSARYGDFVVFVQRHGGNRAFKELLGVAVMNL